MNLESIKAIINSDYPSDVREKLVIVELAKDKNVIPTMLEILSVERETKNDILKDSNSELSRALVTIMDEKYAAKGQIVDRYWVAGEIKKHYLKWKDFIRCNFKIDGLPD